MHSSKPLLGLVAATFLLPAGNASAFTRAEHQWISRRALCLVSLGLEREPPSASPDRVREATHVLTLLSEGKDGPPPDYGELVAYADYVTFPNQMVDSSKAGAERISSLHVRKRLADSVAEYTEMLRNPHHFRELGFSQFHIWHDTAVARAIEPAVEGRTTDPLIDALAYNAYADHFLEDFFAPGHMTREPDGISHMGNLRVHDTANWNGRLFEPSPVAWEVLGPLLGSSPEARAETASHCFPTEDGIDLADVEDTVAPLSVHVSGDNQVYREGKGVVEGAERQAVFMALMVARSIRDVIESYLSSELHNSFPNRRCPELSPDAEWLARASPPDDCYFVLEESEENYYLAGMPLGGYLSAPEAQASPLLWPTLGGSTELQKIGGTSRWQTSLELLFDLPAQEMFQLVGLDYDWTRHFSFELGTGYSYINKGALEGGTDYNGHGPDVRLYLRAKQLYMFVAAEVGYRFYYGKGQSVNNFRAAGRLGFGNGIFWAYGSIARDQKLTDMGGELDWTAVGFGVSVTIPSTRLLGWMWGY